VSVVVICLIVAGVTQLYAYAQSNDKGIISQVIGDSTVEFYVKNVEASVSSGVKEVDVSMIFKNTGVGQPAFYPTSVRLVDSDSREYDPEYSSHFPSIHLPSNDILAWNAEFKILPSSNVSKIYYIPDGSESRLSIDLTKSMIPPVDPPKSTWILSPNKGVKMRNRQMEITINDEKYIGDTYIVDLTIKNIGNIPVSYAASDFKVKDADGFAYSYNIFYSLLSPLLSGELPPGEIVRGDIAFDVKRSSGNMMIVLSGISGVPFLNSGSSPPAQNASKTSVGKSVEIVLGSSNPNNGEFFFPKASSVSKGSTVLWSNEDTTLHTVTSGNPETGLTESGTEFDSIYMAAGKTFEHTFDKAGTFDYYCTLHPFMKGQVIVK